MTPWWLRVVLIFAASRVVTTSILLFFASIQQPNAWTPSSPDYLDFAMIWDSHWYYVISVVGYPSELPIGPDGHVGENAWAFLPGYPVLIRSLEFITGQPYAPLAIGVSVLSSLGAALLFYRMTLTRLPEGTALFSVALFCFAPLSPILQVGYAEAFHLLLLTGALYLLLERRYALLVPLVIVTALTRPSGLAFALLLGLHAVVRFATRRTDPFPLRERIGVIVAGVASALAGITWPVAAWMATGHLAAYTETELSWRSAYIGYTDLIPFTPWVQGIDWWLRWNRLVEPVSVIVAILLVVLLVLILALLLFTPAAKRIGVDLRLWLASYALYLLAVWFPQSSTFRLLMPMFPALAIVAQPRSRWYRGGLIVVCIALQIGWCYIAWWVDGADWTPP